MISFTAKVRKGYLIIVPLFLVAVALVVVAAVVSSADVQGLTVSTPEDRQSFLQSHGYECDMQSETHKQTIVPSEFDEVYSAYNDLQKAQDFDLAPYKGKTVDLYTVHITNYKNDDNVYACLMVLDGNIIGGDVHSTELDGFMKGF